MLAAFCLTTSVQASRITVSNKYLIASFPDLQQVNYIRVPDPTWRPLILAGLLRPKAIAVDANNMRLFLVDEMAMHVVWYSLMRLDSGLLMTDGRPHMVTSTIIARNIAVDDLGAVFVAGRYDPGPPVVPIEAVFKFSASQISQSALPNFIPIPTIAWDAQDASGGGPATAQLIAANTVVVDSLNVYWGNSNRVSAEGASVVRAALHAAPETPEDFVWVLANNVDKVDALVLTSSDVYYAANGKVYGVPKRKTNEMCTGNGGSCPEVVKKKDNDPTALKVSAMAWDGEGTVFVADRGAGSIYGFSCGSLNMHLLEQVTESPGIFGMTLFVPISAAARLAGRATHGVLLGAVVALTGLGRAVS